MAVQSGAYMLQASTAEDGSTQTNGWCHRQLAPPQLPDAAAAAAGSAEGRQCPGSCGSRPGRGEPHRSGGAVLRQPERRKLSRGCRNVRCQCCHEAGLLYQLLLQGCAHLRRGGEEGVDGLLLFEGSERTGKSSTTPGSSTGFSSRGGDAPEAGERGGQGKCCRGAGLRACPWAAAPHRPPGGSGAPDTAQPRRSAATRLLPPVRPRVPSTHTIDRTVGRPSPCAASPPPSWPCQAPCPPAPPPPCRGWAPQWPPPTGCTCRPAPAGWGAAPPASRIFRAPAEEGVGRRGGAFTGLDHVCPTTGNRPVDRGEVGWRRRRRVATTQHLRLPHHAPCTPGQPRRQANTHKRCLCGARTTLAHLPLDLQLRPQLLAARLGSSLCTLRLQELRGGGMEP